jgi:SAM-dependent methyltransferase
MDPSRFLNRPMLERDLPEIGHDRWAGELRRLVAEYREQGLPLVNGDLAFSNLLEGPAQMLTCHPYRLWEYSSLFKVLGEPHGGSTFLDVGGAASPLPFLLAEHGARGVTLDLQPLLVCLSNHVSQVRGLDLRAEVADAAAGIGGDAEFDFATCVSVIEHVPRDRRSPLFRNIARAIKPGGFLYLTFDYGTYAVRDSRQGHESSSETIDESLSDLAPLCDDLRAAGLAFVENDPRQLPDEVIALKAAPHHAAVARRMVASRRPFDAETAWLEIGRYVGRRLLGLGRRPATRYARHNFFRLFLTRES